MARQEAARVNIFYAELLAYRLAALAMVVHNMDRLARNLDDLRLVQKLTKLWRSSKSPSILEQQNELPFVRWSGLEAKTTIERLGILVDGVCQHSPNARLLSNCNRSADCVLQQAETKTLPLVIEIDCKPRQNNQRNRVMAHPATNPLGSIERVDLANCQTEVPGDAVPITGDERFRRTATLSLACVSQQPVGEGRFPAVKLFQSMIRIQ